MNAKTLTQRLVAAALSVSITFVLVSGIADLANPPAPTSSSVAQQAAVTVVAMR